MHCSKKERVNNKTDTVVLLLSFQSNTSLLTEVQENTGRHRAGVLPEARREAEFQGQHSRSQPSSFKCGGVYGIVHSESFWVCVCVCQREKGGRRERRTGESTDGQWALNNALTRFILSTVCVPSHPHRLQANHLPMSSTQLLLSEIWPSLWRGSQLQRLPT